jgi:hypothetical protein
MNFLPIVQVLVLAEESGDMSVRLSAEPEKDAKKKQKGQTIGKNTGGSERENEKVHPKRRN